MAEVRPAQWVIVLHLGLEGCSQPRELWFSDILMYIYMYMYCILTMQHAVLSLGAGSTDVSPTSSAAATVDTTLDRTPSTNPASGKVKQHLYTCICIYIHVHVHVQCIVHGVSVSMQPLCCHCR